MISFFLLYNPKDKVDGGGKVEFDDVVPDGIGDELDRDYKTVAAMDQPLGKLCVSVWMCPGFVAR